MTFHLSEVSLGTGINRFYVVQLLKVHKRGGGGGFEIFCHWGRTGSEGAEWEFASSRSDFNVYTFRSRSRAVSEFKKWFYKKTNNEWDERRDFEQKPQCNNGEWVNAFCMQHARSSTQNLSTRTCTCAR